MRAALLESTSYPCPYLPDRIASMEQFLVYAISPGEHALLLAYGYRHFGGYYFRPACGECRRCVPVRIAAQAVSARRSWRRLLNRTRRLAVEIDRPPAEEEAFELYRLHKRRFSDGENPSPELFRESFFTPHPVTRLLTIRDGDRLVGVCHFDETPGGLSAVYTYYDDVEYAWASPGKLAIISLLDRALRLDLRRLYLGYFVHGNGAMSYKADYTPLEYSPAGGVWMKPDRPLGELRFDPGDPVLSR